MANNFQIDTLALSGQLVTATGSNLYINGDALAKANATGQFISTAQTGIFYPASNPNNYITSAQAGGVSSLTVTGASLSGNINLTGLRGINVSLSGTYILISGGDTGQFITNAQTGQFAPSGMTGQFITTAITGNAFYPRVGNPDGFLTNATLPGGGGVTKILITGTTVSGNVTMLGTGNISVFTGVPNTIIISGWDTGQYVTTAMTGQFAPSGMTGQFVTTNKTGGFVSISQTGQFLDTSDTGWFVTTGNTGVFVTIFQTGQFAPSGMTGQFITTSQTGHVHSQYLTGPYGVTSLISTGFVWSGSSVTGIAYSGNIILTGGGNISVFTGATSGYQTIVISGNTGNLVFQGMTGQFVDSAHTGGFVSISQTGQFVTTAQTGQFAPSGMTGQFITTAQTGIFYPSSNPNNYITAAQAGGVSAITVTGASVSGSVNFTGLRGINVSLSGQYVLISGGDTGQFVDSSKTGGFVSISQTGQFVDTAQSGLLVNAFIRRTETGQFAPSGMTGQFITTAQTGIFYPSSNPNNYITAAQAGGVSAVTVTGASISGSVNFTGLRGINVSISGQYVLISGGDTGQFITTAQTGQFVDSSKTGQFITTAQTGQFAPSGMTGQFITTAQTGQFAPSGLTGQFVTTAQTGHIHSQYLTGPYGVTSLIATGFIWSGTAITGIAYSGNIVISGGGNISVFTGSTSGLQTIIISGITGNLVFQGMTGQLLDSSDTGNFITNTQTGGFVYSGNTGVFVTIFQTGQFAPSGMTGQFITTAQTGHIHSQYLTGPYGVTNLMTTGFVWSGSVVTGITYSGSILISGGGNISVFTGAISGFQSIIISGITGNLVFQGMTGQFVDTAHTGGFVSISQTGQFVDTAQSGLLVNAFPRRTETGQFAPSGMTGQFITTAQTGIFYPASNPNNYITAAQAGGVSAVTVTGASVSGSVNFTGLRGINVSLSGQYVLISGGDTGQFIDSSKTGGFVSTSQTGQFAPSGMTGQFITTAQTGQFAPAAQMVTQVMTGMVPQLLLVVTGQVLSGNWQVTGVSGINVYTSGTQLVFNTYNITSATGQFLTSNTTGQYITTAQTGQFAPSGMTGQFITTAQTGQYAPAGLTGQFVSTSMTGVLVARGETGHIHSQYLTGPYGVTSLITTGFIWSGTAITGIAYSGNIIITGGGNISVFTGATSGYQTIVISGNTGNLVFQGMTGQFLDTSDTGNFVTITQTGQFVDSSKTGTFVTTTDHRTITLDGTLVVSLADITVTAGAPVHKINVNSASLYRAGQGASQVSVDWVNSLLKTGTAESKSTLDWNNLWLGESGNQTLNWKSRTMTGTWDIQGLTVAGQSLVVGNTGQFITTAQTGQFAPSGMTGQFITSAQTGQFAPSGMTGQFVTTNKTGGFVSISQTGQFVDSSKTGGFVSISQTGQFITTAQTGQFAPITQMVTQAMTGMVPESFIVVTGQVLSGNIPFTGISGVSIYTSGTQLVFSTYGITSATGQFITTAQTGQYAPAGLTGQFVTTAMTGHPLLLLNVTGQVLSGNLFITGISNISTYTSGNYLVFSGGAGQGTTTNINGVSSLTATGFAWSGAALTGQTYTGNIILTGAGNITVITGNMYSSYNVIVISGSTVVGGATSTGICIVATGSSQIISGGLILSGQNSFLTISGSGNYFTLGTGLAAGRGNLLFDVLHSGYATGIPLADVGTFAIATGGSGIYNDLNANTITLGCRAFKYGPWFGNFQDAVWSALERSVTYNEGGSVSQDYCLVASWTTIPNADGYKIRVTSNNYSALDGASANTAYFIVTGSPFIFGSGKAPQSGMLYEIATSPTPTYPMIQADNIIFNSGYAKFESKIQAKNVQVTGQIHARYLTANQTNLDRLYVGKGGAGEFYNYFLNTLTATAFIYDPYDAPVIASPPVLVVRGQGNINSGARWRGRSSFGGDFTSVTLGEFTAQPWIMGTSNARGFITSIGVSATDLFISPTGFINTYIGKTGTIASASFSPLMIVSNTSGNVTITGFRVITQADTGIFATASAGGVTSINVSGIAINGAITITGIAGIGASLSGNAIIISGNANQTGQFITTNMTGQYAPAGLTGQFVTTAMTGHPLLLLNVTGQVLSGNLPVTGISGIRVYMSGTYMVISGGGSSSTAGVSSIIYSGGNSLQGTVRITGNHGIVISGGSAADNTIFINPIRGTVNLGTGQLFGHWINGASWYPRTIVNVNWNSGEMFQYICSGSGQAGPSNITSPKVIFVHTGVTDGKRIVCSFINTGVSFFATNGQPIFSGEPKIYSGIHWEDSAVGGTPIFPGWVGLAQGTTAESHMDVYEFTCIGKMVFGTRIVTNAFIAGAITL